MRCRRNQPACRTRRPQRLRYYPAARTPPGLPRKPAASARSNTRPTPTNQTMCSRRTRAPTSLSAVTIGVLPRFVITIGHRQDASDDREPRHSQKITLLAQPRAEAVRDEVIGRAISVQMLCWRSEPRDRAGKAPERSERFATSSNAPAHRLSGSWPSLPAVRQSAR